jgi:hypothetical protein
MTERPTSGPTSLDPALSAAVRSLLFRLPAYGQLYWRLLRQGNLTGGQRALALAAVTYHPGAGADG